MRPHPYLRAYMAGANLGRVGFTIVSHVKATAVTALCRNSETRILTHRNSSSSIPITDNGFDNAICASERRFSDLP
jgi:hypothetical protein